MPRKRPPPSPNDQNTATFGQQLTQYGSAPTRLTPDQAASFVPLTEREDWQRAPGKARQYQYTANPNIRITYRQYINNFRNKVKQIKSWNVVEFKKFPPAEKYIAALPANAILMITAYGIPFTASPPAAPGKKAQKQWMTVQPPIYQPAYTGNASGVAYQKFSKVERIAVWWKLRP